MTSSGDLETPPGLVPRRGIGASSIADEIAEIALVQSCGASLSSAIIALVDAKMGLMSASTVPFIHGE